MGEKFIYIDSVLFGLIVLNLLLIVQAFITARTSRVRIVKTISYGLVVWCVIINLMRSAYLITQSNIALVMIPLSYYPLYIIIIIWLRGHYRFAKEEIKKLELEKRKLTAEKRAIVLKNKQLEETFSHIEGIVEQADQFITKPGKRR